MHPYLLNPNTIATLKRLLKDGQSIVVDNPYVKITKVNDALEGVAASEEEIEDYKERYELPKHYFKL